MDDSKDKTHISADDMWASIRHTIKQYLSSSEAEYQELLDQRYVQVIEQYYRLTIKPDLTDKESDWLSSILTDAEANEELAVILELVDEATFELLGYNDEAFKAEIERACIKIGEEVLESSYSLDEAVSPHDIEKEADVRNELTQPSTPDGKPPRESFSGRFLSLMLEASSIEIQNPFSKLAMGVCCILLATSTYQLSKLTSEIESRQPVAGERKSHSKEKIARLRASGHCSEKEVRWIDPELEGNKTAYGVTFSSADLTASHPFLPPESVVYIQPNNQQDSKISKPVAVSVIDTGSTVTNSSNGLLVSYTAAQALDIVQEGVAEVHIEGITVNNRRTDDLTEVQQRKLSEFSRDCSGIIDNLGQTQDAITEIESSSSDH